MIIIYRLDAPKSIFETEKILKPSLLGKYIKKNKKKQKKTKNPKKFKKTQKTHWAGCFFLNPGFFQPCLGDDGSCGGSPRPAAPVAPCCVEHTSPPATSLFIHVRLLQIYVKNHLHKQSDNKAKLGLPLNTNPT